MTSLILCVISALALGFAQPFYMPAWFGEVSGYQQWLSILTFVGYVPLFLAIANKNLKSTFWLSFFSLSVQFTITLYWIYVALHVHGHIPPIFSGIITLCLPFLLALKISVFLVIARLVSDRFSWSFFLIAPVALCAGEYFRNFYVFGGFPWGNVGYGVGQIDQFLQIASLVGIYGLVFFVGVVNALFAHSIAHKNRTSLVAALVVIFGAFSYGAYRLRGASNEFAPSLRVAVLQGNIEQERKSKSRLYAGDIIDIYKDLHNQAKAQGAELIIWPESAYPRSVVEDIQNMPLDFLDNTGTIIGAVAYGDEPNGQDYHVRNAAFMVDHQNHVVKRYDKSHLVPFGEYVPWPMNGVVDKIVPGMGAFLPGTDYEVIPLALSLSKTIKVGATICYEGIFPEISRAYARNGAELLVNLTNDAWYGSTSAPYQHLHMYRVRSVETGLPFIRATNSGISATVDAYGRLGKSLPLFERGLIVEDISLVNKKTLYAVAGDVLPIICLLLMIVFYVAAVIPIHQFIRQRNYKKLGVVLAFSAIALMTHNYYTNPRFITDESAATKNFLVLIIVMLFMVGLLVRTKRSKAILSVCGPLIFLVSLGLSVVESPYFLVGAVIGLLIYLVAFSIKIPKPSI